MAGSTATALGDVLKLRSTKPQRITPTLNVLPPQIVGTATLSSSPLNYPVTELAISSLSTDFTTLVQVGQLVKITSPTDSTRAWGVVRKAPTSSVFYIDQKKLGDAGLTQFIEDAIAIGDTLTVYSHRPPWMMFSRISGGQFYKQFDLAYVDQNSNPPPVANCGPWQHGYTTEYITFPRAGVNTSFDLGNYGLTHQWDIGDGSLYPGDQLSYPVIRVKFPPGVHEVTDTVTNKTGQTHTGVTRAFVEDANNPSSFGSQYTWQVQSSDYTPKGRSMTIQVYGDGLSEDQFLPGAAVLYTERTIVAESHVTDGTLVDNFLGYVTHAEWSHTGQVPSVVLTVKGPGLLWPDRNAPSQLMVEQIPPADWTQVTAIMSNPIGMVYYLLKWHAPTFLDCHDLDVGQYDSSTGTVDLYNSPLRKMRKLAIGFAGGHLGSQLDYILGDRGNVGTFSDGTVAVRLYPYLEDNDFRNALPVVWDWTTQDLVGPLTYPQQITPSYGEVTGAGKRYLGGGTTGIQLWGGQRTGGQGRNKGQIQEFVIAYDEDLTKVKAVVGHYYAFLNTPAPEVELNAMRNLDVVDPPAMAWTTLTVDPAYDPRGNGFDNARAIATKVSYTYQVQGGQMMKRVTVTLQLETYGQPADEMPLDQGGAAAAYDFGWRPNEPVPFRKTDTNERLNTALAYNDNGKLARTFGFATLTPQWSDLTSYFTGNVNWVQWDWWSNYFTKGRINSDPAGMFVVTTDASNLYIYYITDLKAKELEVTLQHTEALTTTATGVWAMVDVSRSTNGFVGVCYREQGQVYTLRSTNGGSSWVGPTAIGSAISPADTSHDNYPIGYVIDGDLQLAPGWDGTQYTIHYATTTGGSFTDSTLVGNASPHRLITSGFDSYQYAARVSVSTTTDSVNLFATADYDAYVQGVDLLQQAWSSLTAATDAWSQARNTLTDNSGVRPAFLDLEVSVTLFPGVFNTENHITSTGLQLIPEVRVVNTSSTAGFGSCTITYDGQVDFEDEASFTFSGTDTNFTSSNPDVIDNFLGGSDYEHLWVPNVLASEDFTDKKISGYRVHITIDQPAAPNPETWQLIANELRFDTTPITYSGAALFRLNGFDATPAATSITPSAGKVPARPAGLSADVVNRANLVMMGVSGTTWNRFSSTDRGTGWAQNVSDSKYRGVLENGQLYILFGAGALDVTADAFNTVVDRLGNLAAVWGAAGEIKNVKALIEG